jgi:hypothetical protein
MPEPARCSFEISCEEAVKPELPATLGVCTTLGQELVEPDLAV